MCLSKSPRSALFQAVIVEVTHCFYEVIPIGLMLVEASMKGIDDVSLVGCLLKYMEAQFACNSTYTCYLI